MLKTAIYFWSELSGPGSPEDHCTSPKDNCIVLPLQGLEQQFRRSPLRCICYRWERWTFGMGNVPLLAVLLACTWRMEWLVFWVFGWNKDFLSSQSWQGFDSWPRIKLFIAKATSERKWPYVLPNSQDKHPASRKDFQEASQWDKTQVPS
jgi:hypothetical protein